MSDRVLALVTEGEEAARALPMPVIAYFIVTFSLFLVALGITWSFRNTAYKVQQPHHGPRGAAGTAIEPGHDGSHH